VVFNGGTTRNMKTPWTILSAATLYKVMLSVSIHMLIFSIPVSMVINPQTQEMELFFSLEDARVTPDSMKTQMEAKNPGSGPAKKINIPIEAPLYQMNRPEMIEPVKEARVEPFKEVKKEPVEEADEEPKKVESESISQLATENKEGSFVLALPSGIEGSSSGVPTGETSIGMASGVGRQPPGSHNAIGGGTGNLIETRFGAFVAPAFLHREMPIYPMMARKLGREGRVMLKLTIDEKGNLLDVEVIEKAGYGFTEAAVEGVRKSTFLPAKKDGKAIASRALLPVRFQLERN
jgi:TonB family protein